MSEVPASAPSAHTPASFVGCYDFKETLGKGHYAVVKRAQHVISNHHVAVKIIDKQKLDEVELNHLHHEVRVMKLLRHPSVIRLYQIVDTPNRLFLILELGNGGDMYERIKTRGAETEDGAKRIVRQLVSALLYCHNHYVAHRDLKPENIVFCIDPDTNTETVKITDFGLCNNYQDGMMMDTFCGSMVYSSPEVLLQEPYSGPKADVWSLGVVLYMLLTGRLPFQEVNDSETLIKILEANYSTPESISYECSDLLRNILVRDPEQRLSMKEVSEHAWLRESDDSDEPELNFDIPAEEEGVKNDLMETFNDKDLHDRVVTILDTQAGISKAEIEEALKSKKYDYVASTYHLVLEQQKRQQAKRRSTGIAKKKKIIRHANTNTSLLGLVSPPPERLADLTLEESELSPAGNTEHIPNSVSPRKRPALRVRPRPGSYSTHAAAEQPKSSKLDDDLLKGLATLNFSPKTVHAALKQQAFAQRWSNPEGINPEENTFSDISSYNSGEVSRRTSLEEGVMYDGDEGEAEEVDEVDEGQAPPDEVHEAVPSLAGQAEKRSPPQQPLASFAPLRAASAPDEYVEAEEDQEFPWRSSSAEKRGRSHELVALIEEEESDSF
eukprot:m.27878 g.27878  ORF g.27878 m.27878 type:complete len:611 (+) comp7947_c0_seq2:351-2183(+)